MGTPTALVDGETVAFESTEDLVTNLRSAVEAALAE